MILKREKIFVWILVRHHCVYTLSSLHELQRSSSNSSIFSLKNTRLLYVCELRPIFSLLYSTPSKRNVFKYVLFLENLITHSTKAQETKFQTVFSTKSFESFFQF